MEAVVGEMLAERGLRIALAESCTGGLLTSRLTDVPGSSRYVVEAVIAYANEAKTNLLDVPAPLIAAHGAVSEPVAIAMANGGRARADVDFGVGVTGIAGPGGGTPEKPVGLVWIAVNVAGQVRTHGSRFIGDRAEIRFRATQAALDLVRRMVAS